ncbi:MULTISPECIES: hypothetical protein [Bradyrhizobium]|uniref:hypothetical protein n=1 Tax=Bradyrhizobium TaxID=374 RepID=UPI00155ABDA2|nr:MULTISPECIES: hypothetical protein [Bradyrhizobium]MCC8941992.1 hypothetical protein [Bradyrhizobium ivorense]
MSELQGSPRDAADRRTGLRDSSLSATAIDFVLPRCISLDRSRARFEDIAGD